MGNDQYHQLSKAKVLIGEIEKGAVEGNESQVNGETGTGLSEPSYLRGPGIVVLWVFTEELVFIKIAKIFLLQIPFRITAYLPARIPENR